MERIGIAASNVAKGNLFFYNLFVICIASLFCGLIFFLSAFSILVALVLMAYVSSGFVALQFNAEWYAILRICLGVLAFIVGIINLVAIFRNVKVTLKK